MNLLHPENPKEWLREILDEIHEYLAINCLKYAEEYQTIYVATWDEVQNKYKDRAKTINGGFAYSTHQSTQHEHKKLIILQEDNYRAADLSPDELKAILFHELGHLLNFPELEPEMTIMECLRQKVQYNKEESEAAVKRNKIKKEIYADAYTKQHGFTEHTIRGFEKYRNWSGNDIGFQNERIDALNSEDAFIGIIQPVNTQGF